MRNGNGRFSGKGGPRAFQGHVFLVFGIVGTFSCEKLERLAYKSAPISQTIAIERQIKAFLCRIGRLAKPRPLPEVH